MSEAIAQLEGAATPLPMAGLETLLDAQEAVLRDLVALAVQERQAIAHNDAAALQQLTAERDRLSQQVEALEARRIQLLRPWAEANGRDPELLTMSSLAACAPGAVAQHLTNRRDRLNRLVTQLSGLNHQNQLLYQSVLASISTTIAVFSAITSQDSPLYSAAGQRTARSGSSSSFDRRA